MRVHLVGIGGAGMSALAHLYLERGDGVSGSDSSPSATIDALVEGGARVHIGHGAVALQDADLVVRSTAIPDDNPELQAARGRGLRVISRGEAAAEVCASMRQVVVTGTHGKTTTTTLAAKVMRSLEPLVLSGGRLPGSLFNSTPGAGRFAVVEGDESDGSHLRLAPEIGIVTSVEADHLDHYRGMDEIREAFVLFATGVSSLLVACVDDRGAAELLAVAPGETLSYGFSPADVHGDDYTPLPTGAEFSMYTPWGDRKVNLHMPGRHNARNAMAAAAAGLRLGLDLDGIVSSLAAARLPGRRMELVAEVNGAAVYDDYSHLPTEIRAALAAARELALDGRVVVAFQPHRVSRLAALMREFGHAFGDADEVLLVPLYSAGEAPIAGVDSAALADAIQRVDPLRPVTVLENLDQLEEALVTQLAPGDVAICMGAGDIYKVTNALVGRGYGRPYEAAAP